MAAFDQPPQLSGPILTGIVDADACGRRDQRPGFARRRRLQVERRTRATQVNASPGPIQTECSGNQARATRQAMGRQRFDPGGLRGCLLRTNAAPTHRSAQDPVHTHGLDSLERFDGADQKCGRCAAWFGHHVQAVVHPVDKVHVGQARRSEHDPVARRLTEASVRCPVVASDVCLDLDDPPDSAAGGILPDEPCADERVAGLQCGRCDDRPVEDGQNADA